MCAQAQLLQFCVCMAHAWYCFATNIYPRWICLVEVWVMASMLVLFTRFYRKSYQQAAARKAANGGAAAANGAGPPAARHHGLDPTPRPPAPGCSLACCPCACCSLRASACFAAAHSLRCAARQARTRSKSRKAD